MGHTPLRFAVEQGSESLVRPGGRRHFDCFVQEHVAQSYMGIGSFAWFVCFVRFVHQRHRLFWQGVLTFQHHTLSSYALNCALLVISVYYYYYYILHCSISPVNIVMHGGTLVNVNTMWYAGTYHIVYVCAYIYIYIYMGTYT